LAALPSAAQVDLNLAMVLGTGEAVSKVKCISDLSRFKVEAKNLRATQSEVATPARSVLQHLGLEKVAEWQRVPASPPPAGMARATATLARTEVIMKNRILI